MASKLIKGALRPRTYDEQDDIAMKGRGASHVFRNMAFQDEEPEKASASSRVNMNTQESLKKNNFFGSVQEPTSIDVTPRTKDNGNGMAMWNHIPDVATSKRAGSSVSVASNSGRIQSAVKAAPPAGKRTKSSAAASTAVQSISAFEHETADEVSGSEDGTGGAQVIAVHHVPRGPSVSNGNPSTSVRVWEEEIKRLICSGQHEEALKVVAPTDGLIRCTVRRVKNFLGQTLAYHLYMDSGDTFLIAARKRKKSKASNYILSTSTEDLSRESDHCVAKLRANFVGTEYALASRVAAPSEEGKLAPPAEPYSQDELAVHYKQTALKAKAGPRVMLVATPLPEAHWAPSAADGSDQLAACLELARQRELAPRLERQLCMLATRPPEWDPALKAYTLDFHGRVRASSVKNFQLVHWDHNTDRKGSDLVLQFGKIDEGSEDFALDFTYPLSIQKAFSIALASIDSKLCYAL